jgi:ubiquinone biosynthesis O-methyltransferase
MEVIEHVQNQKAFVNNIAKTVKPDGLIFLSTIARSTEAWLLTIKLCEDAFGMIPQGTHNWDKFLNPEELHEMVEESG